MHHHKQNPHQTILLKFHF